MMIAVGLGVSLADLVSIAKDARLLVEATIAKGNVVVSSGLMVLGQRRPRSSLPSFCRCSFK